MRRLVSRSTETQISILKETNASAKVKDVSHRNGISDALDTCATEIQSWRYILLSTDFSLTLGDKFIVDDLVEFIFPRISLHWGKTLANVE